MAELYTSPAFWKVGKSYPIDILNIHASFYYPFDKVYKNRFDIVKTKIFTKLNVKSGRKMILFNEPGQGKISHIHWRSPKHLNNLFIRGRFNNQRKMIDIFCNCELPKSEIIITAMDDIIQAFHNHILNNIAFPFRVDNTGYYCRKIRF